MKEIQGQSFLQNHPCYNKDAAANWGRLHLPVAQIVTFNVIIVIVSTIALTKIDRV